MGPKFGTAGNPDSFYNEGHKSSSEMPAWLIERGLDAYEVQFGKGVTFGAEAAQKLGKAAKDAGVTITVHAPYYISLSSAEEIKRDNSIKYMLNTAEIAGHMGAKRIVVHSGTVGKMDRGYALELAKDTLKKIIAAVDEAGYGHITICPEVMGKINQLGTVEEVIELCGLDERLIPTIDFGHYNARTKGALKTVKDVEKIFDDFINTLGIDRVKEFHSHFSKIEYSSGGEVKHLTFADDEYGPDFSIVAEAVYKYGFSPIFICESRGTQSEDAVEMKKVYDLIADNI